MDLLQEAIKNTPRKTPLYVKIFGLFSVIRGYNIALLVIAQYLTAIFIFSPNHSIEQVLLNPELYFIVFSTICVVAGGYIINNFYDAETDKINRPLRHRIDNIVSQKMQLTLYFTLNFLGVLVAFLVSLKAVLFFSVYIFGIWFYSHKLKKYPLTGFLSAPILTILPFFVIFVYYRNFSEVIFINATFLFYILLIKELIKQLKTLKGNFVYNYQTIAVKYGEKFTKMLITILSTLTIIPIYFLLKHPELGGMKYYYHTAVPLLFLFNIVLWFTKTQKGYILLDIALKLFILTGVFSIITIG
ncbi:MAG: geranylgeranylglycerol-phosphate geranylgeranyltransferase [Flavobacteriaceae bacterium]|nr:geranylgeranylglycerol-phosphate geranylgeranyltransferase [Flavobacteriaceae bacterium]